MTWNRLAALSKWTVASIAGVGILALAAGLWTLGSLGGAPEAEATGQRTISVLAIQHAMYRDMDRTPFPDTLEEYPDLEAGGGYRLDPPDEDGQWYARAYAWSPGTVVVTEGEEVTLEFFGIHGDDHPTVIEGYDLSFDVHRGELTEVTFTADQTGVFPIICVAHLPSMVGHLVVLPQS